MFMCPSLRQRMRMEQPGVVVILMNVFEWCQAKRQHQGNTRL
jgi:hypothetical protein